ncbi:hypothetical protein RCOM_2082130, partial [Ricinus communis]
MKYSSFILGLLACIWLPNLLQVSFGSPLISHRRIPSNSSSPGVQLHEKDPQHVVIDNGIVQVTLSKPYGFVTGIKYNNIENVLESKNTEENRGYWDVVWYKPGEKENID